jgi:outer membrane protease
VKNITGFAVLVIIFLCAPILAAQEKLADSHALSLSYQTGIWYGQAEEIVYPPASAYSGTELYSQLLWDMRPVWYNGLLLDFGRINPLTQWSVIANFSFKYGFPGKSGTMDDRDWLSAKNDALTNFSSHDNNTKEVIMIDGAAGVAIPIQGMFLLKVFAQASYMRFSFSGMDGYGIYAEHLGNGAYAPIDDNPTLYTFSGKVINYTQEWMVAALGHSFTINFYDHFSAGWSVLISPFIACSGFDEHLLTHTQFSDYMQGGLFLEQGAELSFAATQWLTLSVDYSWRYISRTKGSSYNRAYGTEYHVPGGEAGAGLSVSDASLRVKVRL